MAQNEDLVCGLERNGGPLPFMFLQRIQSLKGNDVCFDCGALDPDWASVNQGTMVCLKCAGRHRTLGVHISRIKSLTMDTWEPVHVLSMLLSGNQQVKGFFSRQHIENTNIETLYTKTRAAEYYRTELQKQVSLELAKMNSGVQCVLDDVPPEPASPTASPRTNPSMGGSPEYFEVVITSDQLGFTLHRDVTPFGNLSKVTRVKEGGAAHQAGVIPGDYVVGAATRMISDFDELMSVVPRLERPLYLTVKRPAELIATAGHVPQQTPDAMARLYRTCGNEANIQAPQVVAPIVKRSPSFKTRTPSGGSMKESTVMPTITDEDQRVSAFRRGDLVEVLQISEDNDSKPSNDEGTPADTPADTEAASPSEDATDANKAADQELETSKDNKKTEEVEKEEAEKEGAEKVAEAEKEVWMKARVVRVFAGGVTVRYLEKEEMEEVTDMNRVSALAPNQNTNATLPEGQTEGSLAVSTEEGDEEEEVVGKEPELAPDPNLPDWLQSGPIETPKPKPTEKKATATKGSGEVKFGDEYEVTFSAGRMGFRLQQEPRTGAAMVVHVVPYEAASCAGVKVGDVVVGMEGHYVPHYETIMSWLGTAPRPLRMLFRKQSDRPAATPMVLGASEVSASGLRAPMKKAPGTYPGFPSQPAGFGQNPSPYAPHVGATARIGEMPRGNGGGGYRPGQSPLANLGTLLGDKLNEFIKEAVSESPKSMPPPPPWQQPASYGQPPFPNQAPGYTSGQTTGYQSYAPQPSYPMGNANRANPNAGFGAQYQFPAEIIPQSGTSMTTKVEIGELSACDEVDILFNAGPLGMRLDERGSTIPVSLVTSLVPNGQAALAGVEIGCTVVGINGERFISHAHTISTLKHGKRPIKLRMRYPDA